MKEGFVIAIVGMSGAGKSQAGEFFKRKGLQVLRFGSVVDDAVGAAGLSWTPENTALFRAKLREELGMAAIAIKILPKIQDVLATDGSVILDGLYSWEEYLFLKEKIPHLQLLCVYAKPAIRHERLKTRSERSFTKEEAEKRDLNEIEVTNKGGPIAAADYLIKNETTYEAFDKALEEYWQVITI
jgi:dephospho-CoA kinase